MATVPFVNSIFQWLGYATYNTTPPTTANAQQQSLQCDVNGALLVNVAGQGGVVAPTWKDFANVASGVIKNTGGSLYSIFFENPTNTTLYMMVFDAAAVPSNGAVPLLRMPAQAYTSALWPLPRPKPFTSGICWAMSTSASTLTLAATSHVVNAEYK